LIARETQEADAKLDLGDLVSLFKGGLWGVHGDEET
jgi:hypothetical protein